MEQFTEGESTREEIKNKLRQNFDGKNAPPCQGTAKIYPLTGERSKPPALFYCHETIAIDLLLENFIAADRGIPAATDSRATI